MKVSLNTIKQYIDFELPPVGELVDRINQQLGGVEEVTYLAERYKGVVIIKVVKCGDLENSDHLHRCLVDDGGVTPDVPRDERGLVQVITGASNVYAGMIAVWLPPGTVVPETFGSEPFTLESRKMRGAMSHGMLASSRELAIGSAHEGIVEITEKDTLQGHALQSLIGKSFAEVFGLDDIIIDIENKMFTHRPDLFGQLGVAREIAGIFGQTFKSPDWYLDAPTFKQAEGLELDVFNEANSSVPRFMAVAIKGIEVAESPLWLQCALVAMGSKSINTIVDITNYVMLLTAQPTHAYDYDKIRGHKLGARMARDGEKVTLLNGKAYELSEDDIVIADADGPVGLGGIMGGFESEVTTDTKNIILEVATFDMYMVRKSSMRHGLFTDALTRFNKGQSSLQNDHVINVLMMSIQDVSPGEQASDVFDVGDFDDCIGTDFIHKVGGQDVTGEFINNRLGLSLENADIKQLLNNVEFKVESDEKGLSIYDPFWRTDIEEPEDIVEEVGRLHGFNKLPRELPRRTIAPAPANERRVLKGRIRSLLASAGANEVVTYSFVHENVFTRSGQSSENAYRLTNSLSPDLQYYRQSLSPSLLGLVHANSKAGYDAFALFELGRTHDKPSGMNEEGVPNEHDRLALTYASKDLEEGAPFYKAKSFVEFLTGQLAIKVVYEPLGSSSTSPVAAPFEPKRSAVITDGETGAYLGIVGEYTKAVQRNFKLPEYATGFELDIEALLQSTQQAEAQYRPLSRFPGAQRDISLKVKEQRTYGEVLTALQVALPQTELDVTVSPVGIYRPPNGGTKNITFRVTLTSYQKTLTSVEVKEMVDAAAGMLKAAINADIV